MSVKTTVYLPDDLKRALEQEALRRGVSEAHLIRSAIQDAVVRPRPRVGFIDGEPIADRVDELMAGFGDR